MIPYQKEKIENAICFFASEHQKKTKHPLYQTFLYKYLAFLDFESLREKLEGLAWACPIRPWNTGRSLWKSMATLTK